MKDSFAAFGNITSSLDKLVIGWILYVDTWILINYLVKWIFARLI